MVPSLIYRDQIGYCTSLLLIYTSYYSLHMVPFRVNSCPQLLKWQKTTDPVTAIILVATAAKCKYLRVSCTCSRQEKRKSFSQKAISGQEVLASLPRKHVLFLHANCPLHQHPYRHLLSLQSLLRRLYSFLRQLQISPQVSCRRVLWTASSPSFQFPDLEIIHIIWAPNQRVWLNVVLLHTCSFCLSLRRAAVASASADLSKLFI
jgi:hypothetical protein